VDAAKQIETLWARIDGLAPRTSKHRLMLGECFYELRSLYSGHQADVRRTLGRGVFEAEIIKRGFTPRTVREWISDFEANLNSGPSCAAKRKARRKPKPDSASASDPLADFARLLPYRAARAAYREAARMLHPDHGGSNLKMQELNAAWERLRDYYVPPLRGN
jgi:hypothetical protein